MGYRLILFHAGSFGHSAMTTEARNLGGFRYLQSKKVMNCYEVPYTILCD